MKAKIFLALNAVLLVVAGACSYYDATPPPENDIYVSVVANSVSYDAGADAALPMDTRQVQVVADIKAPPGDWQIQLEADGALSFKGGDAGAVSTSVHATGNGAVSVQFAAVPEPTGEAVIRATLGTPTSTTLVKTFRFVVQPLLPTIRVCRTSGDGGCLPDEVRVPDAGEADIDDANVKWVPLPSVKEGTFRESEEVGIEISTNPSSTRTGVAWTAKVETDGALVLVDKDNMTTRSRTIDFSPNGSPLIVPARIGGSGAGRAFVSIGNGPKASVLITTTSASAHARRVMFVTHAGLDARNLVTLCSSRLSGALRVSVDLDGGVVSPTASLLNIVPGGPCVDPYPAQAEFFWTGSRTPEIWTLIDGLTDASTFVAVPTLGTELDVRVDATPVWLSTFPDAGGTMGTGTGGTGTGSTATGSTSTGSAADAGVKTAIALVTGTLYRNALGEVAAGTERLANINIDVKAPTGLKVETKDTKTDALGHFSFEVRIEQGTLAKEVTLIVDGRISITVGVIPTNP